MLSRHLSRIGWRSTLLCMKRSGNEALELGRDIEIDPSFAAPARWKERADFNRSLNLSLQIPNERFSPGIGLYAPATLPEILQADIIHLHWVDGFIDLPRFIQALPGKQIVHTLQDMSFFTGGCHYTSGCLRYQDRCGACPQLGSSDVEDLSWQIWRNRMHSALSARMHLIAPSRWISDAVRSSSIGASASVTHIPHGIDLTLFSPGDRISSRHSLGLTPHTPVLVFGAAYDSPRKGMRSIAQTLQALKPQVPELNIIAVGRVPEETVADIPYPVITTGHVQDPLLLREFFRAADLALSTASQEAFGFMNAEIMACGTPLAGFATPGISEMAPPGVHGLLAAPGDTGRLAQEIVGLLKDSARLAALGREAAAHIASHYNMQQSRSHHESLYRELLRFHNLSDRV